MYNWFMFHGFVFYLEAGQQKVERYAFNFSDFIQHNQACNKSETE